MLQILDITHQTPSFIRIGIQWALGVFVFLLSLQVSGQSDIDQLLKEYNHVTVPYISVEELKEHPSDYLLLDTRKREEYLVSHIPDAIWASEVVDSAFAKAYPDRSQPIVVYCSVGIRSEDFGERLQKLGYTNVRNLYGSIFLWKNSGYPLHNQQEKTTDSVHIFSQKWGKYLSKGIKVH